MSNFRGASFPSTEHSYLLVCAISSYTARPPLLTNYVPSPHPPFLTFPLFLALLPLGRRDSTCQPDACAQKIRINPWGTTTLVLGLSPQLRSRRLQCRGGRKDWCGDAYITLTNSVRGIWVSTSSEVVITQWR